jgi:hypothetical protein
MILKKEKNTSKEKEKLVLNLFRYDVAKNIGLTRDSIFLLRELLRWWSTADPYKPNGVEDRSFTNKGFKMYYLSIKKKADDWFYNERTLSECLKKLEQCGVIARYIFQLKRGDDKSKTKKYLGKKLYLIPIAKTLRQLCAIDIPENKQIKDFVKMLESLNPDYETLDKYFKRIKNKEVVNVETISKKGKNKRFSGVKNETIEKYEKELKDKMKNRSKPKTEGKPKMNENEYLTEKDINNLPDDIMDDYRKRQAIENLRNDLKKGIRYPKDYYTNDDYLKDLDENMISPVIVNHQYDEDVCLEDIE